MIIISVTAPLMPAKTGEGHRWGIMVSLSKFYTTSCCITVLAPPDSHLRLLRSRDLDLDRLRSCL